MVKTDNQNILIPAFVKTPEVQPPQTTGQKNGLFSQFDLLQGLRNKLDNLEIENRQLAHLIAKLIPSQCPFERDIVIFGRKVAHVPPLCKLNPLYEQFVGLRFRALCYLVDECGEDIQSYC